MVINGAIMTKYHENKNSGRDQRISVSAARKMLGLIGRNYSDEDIEEILNCLYGFAEEAFEDFQRLRGDNAEAEE